MVEVVAVEVVGHRTVHLWFSDGSERVVDLAPFLSGPMFEEIARDDEVFRSVRADPEARTIVWPNGADLAPEVLHGEPVRTPGGRALSDEEIAELADEVASTDYDIEALRRRSRTMAELIAKADEVAKRLEDFDPAEATEVPVEEYLLERARRLSSIAIPAGLPPEDLPAAAVADILQRGDLDDWGPIAAAIAADPRGSLASTVARLVDAYPMYGTSELWKAWLEHRRARG